MAESVQVSDTPVGSSGPCEGPMCGSSPLTVSEVWGRPSWVPMDDGSSIRLLRINKEGVYVAAWSIYGVKEGTKSDVMQQANAACRLLNEQFPTT